MRKQGTSDNRKALPKFFLMILLSGVGGAALGFGTGLAGAAGLPERAAAALDGFWRAVTPWAIPAVTLVLVGAAALQYRAARRAFAAWDGEDEETIDGAEQKLNWALLWTSLTLVADYLLMAAGMVYHPRSMTALAVVGWFLLSMAAATVAQQKIVDLTKRMNPEKRGSVYDLKFHKAWLDSCDEAEQRQIGRASYKAVQTTSVACVVLWALLVVGNFVFDFGLMPVFAVTLLWGVMQTAYILECIRLEKGTP